MFARILRHEWRTLRADAGIWVVAVAFGAAIAYGVANGSRWVSFQQAALADARAEETARFAQLKAQVADIQRTGQRPSPFADPTSPGNAGGRFGLRYAMLPPGPLAPLAIGQSDLLPYYFKISTDARETIVASTELENPQRLLVGRFDLAFVIIYLYPLLILGLSYNMLSAEKEQGTLALALAQPVSLTTLVSGKVAIRALVLGGLVVLFSLIALAATGLHLSASGAAVRLVLWIGAVAVYGAFWFALAVLVAALGGPSATNATILAGLWLALIVMLPSVFNLVATTLYPVPSRVEMIQAVRVASDEASAAGSTLLAKYYEDHPELASGDAEQAMNEVNIVRVAVNDDVERRVRPVIDRYDRQLARQQALIDSLKFLSPAVLMQDALNDVAGTGTARHRQFMVQVADYHRAWRAYFVPLVFGKMTFTAYDEIPTFRFEEEQTAAVAERAVIALGGLAGPAIVIGWIGLRRMKRYPLVG